MPARVSQTVLVLVMTTAAACGATRAEAPATPAQRAPAVTWDHMTQGEKYAYMTRTVMPEMRDLFVKFDPHRYPKMDCIPCHVRGRAADYRMPNPDLRLDPDACGAAPTTDPSGVSMYEFMAHEVETEMARLLGREEGDVGCFGCHVPER